MSDTITINLRDPEVVRILSYTCPDCWEFSKLLRLGGYDIPRKIEAEQACVIAWMLKYFSQYGPKWTEHAEAELNGIKDKIRQELTSREGG